MNKYFRFQNIYPLECHHILDRLKSNKLSKEFKTRLLDAIDSTSDHDKTRMAHAAKFWSILKNN